MDKTEQADQVEGFVDNQFYLQNSSTDEESEGRSPSADDLNGSAGETSDEDKVSQGESQQVDVKESEEYQKNVPVQGYSSNDTFEEFGRYEEFEEGAPNEEFQENNQLKEIQLGEDFKGTDIEEELEVDNSVEVEEFVENEDGNPVYSEEFEELEVSDPVEGEQYEKLGNFIPLQTDNNNSEVAYYSDKESVPSQGVDFDLVEPAQYSESAGPSFHNLESFTLDATKEDWRKRTETLLRTGRFLTRESYEAFTAYKPNPELRALLELARETEQLKNKKSQRKEQEITEPLQVQSTPVEMTPLSKQEYLETSSPLPKKRKVAAPTVLDTVLTDMMRYNKSQSVKQEPSDLEIAAKAAGLQFPHAPTENQSRFTKEQHAKFLLISTELKSGSNSIAEADMEMYRYMCTEIKHEQDEFMQEQKKQMYSSGLYNTLDPKVEKMIENYCEVEYDRILQYPQYYKYFNILNMPSIPHTTTNDSRILSFKSSLLQTGKIAPCKLSAFETPRRLDLFKKYITVPPKGDDEISIDDDENDTYYKKKYPPTVSHDNNITHLLESNKSDIVICSESLIALVGLIHEISVDLCVPIKVVENNGVRTLLLDRPLPREEMTARERNQLIYDLTFKSLCLDWTKSHDISSTVDENADKEYATEENLQYNMWTFGDMNILIRHQADGEIPDNAAKTPSSKERRVYLTSKLDYQISEGREEIITPKERSANWLRSYIGGHATVIEGRVDVVNNRLLRVERKKMVDIMGGQWRPMLESELLRHTFSQLYKMLQQPGDYLLQHKKDDRNFMVYQSSPVPTDVDLRNRGKIPLLSKTEKSFIPAWSAIEHQIPWTFPPK